MQLQVDQTGRVPDPLPLAPPEVGPLPPALDLLLPGRGRPIWRPLVVGATVRCRRSPVGPYEELLGAVVAHPLGAHVPFLAVDSPVSAAGGRELARAARVGVDVASDRAGEPGSTSGRLLPGSHPGLVPHARLRVGR